MTTRQQSKKSNKKTRKRLTIEHIAAAKQSFFATFDTLLPRKPKNRERRMYNYAHRHTKHTHTHAKTPEPTKHVQQIAKTKCNNGIHCALLSRKINTAKANERCVAAEQPNEQVCLCVHNWLWNRVLFLIRTRFLTRPSERRTTQHLFVCNNIIWTQCYRISNPVCPPPAPKTDPFLFLFRLHRAHFRTCMEHGAWYGDQAYVFTHGKMRIRNIIDHHHITTPTESARKDEQRARTHIPKAATMELQN